MSDSGEDMFKRMTDGLVVDDETAEDALKMMRLVYSIYTSSMLVGFSEEHSLGFAWALFNRIIQNSGQGTDE